MAASAFMRADRRDRHGHGSKPVPMAGESRLVMVAMLSMALVGCTGLRPENPSFPLTPWHAREGLEAMDAEPVELERPVVVAAGLMDPGLLAGSLARRLKRATGDERIIVVHFVGTRSFDACRRRLIEAVEESFPSGDPQQTREVDVVAISMGGLVARYAAIASSVLPKASGSTGQSGVVGASTTSADDGEKRLRMARLFTIATPHRGARLAGLPSFDQRRIDMRAGSAFLERLEAAAVDAEYELYPYARLADWIVGVKNAAPEGEQPWWVPNRLLQPAHMLAYSDARIRADIARRLRNESPFTRKPRAPVPR